MLHKEFEQVIASNQGRIKHIVSRYCVPEEFDDLYQEILLQLWRSFESFKNHSSRETWLYKVALNTACTFISKTVKNRALNESLSEVTRSEELVGQENCQADILSQFMQSLNDTDASILMMYLDGISSQGIAEVIGINSPAIRTRIKRLKHTYEKQYVGDE